MQEGAAPFITAEEESFIGSVPVTVIINDRHVREVREVHESKERPEPESQARVEWRQKEGRPRYLHGQ